MSYRVRLRAELLDTDCATIIADFDDEADGRAFDIHFTDELNGSGEGSCNVPLSHPDIIEIYSGRYIRAWAVPDDDPGDEIIAFSFRIEGNPEYRQVDQGEEVSQFVSVSGRGSGVMLDDAIVQIEDTENDDKLQLDYSYRQFTAFSYWYPNDGDWVLPEALYEYKDQGAAELRGRLQGVVDNAGTPDDTSDDVVNIYVAPIGFPWPLAYHNGDGFDPTPVYDPTYWFIAGDAADEYEVGYHFFRGNFDLDGEQEISFFVTADNWFTLYLQGVPILGEDADMHMWQGYKEITMVLPAGFYVVGLLVHNPEVVSLAHPGAGLFNAIATSVYPGDVETSLTLSVLSSNDSEQWLSHFEATEWPGWTPGQIMLQLIQEAQTRGSLVAYSDSQFGDFLDAALGPWDSVDPDTEIEFIPTFSVRVGTGYLSVLEQLFNEGWVDWHFNHQTNELQMWAQGTVGETKSTQLVAGTGGNIRGLVRGASRPYANALLIQYASGFTDVEDAGEITAFGCRVEDFLPTDAATAVEAERLGRVELQRRIADSRAAVLVDIEPLTGGDNGDCPYFGFALGDYIDIPQIDGVGVDTLQVLAITCDTDAENYAVWRLEANARWRAPAVEVEGLLRQIGGKTMGSPVNRGGAAID